MACKKELTCYTDIQTAIEYCNDNPSDLECTANLPCDCLVDLLNVIDALRANNNHGESIADVNFLKIANDYATIDNIILTASKCRCSELNSYVTSLESNPKCALSYTIVKEGNILAADSTTVATTCNTVGQQQSSSSCQDSVVNMVVGGIINDCTLLTNNVDNSFIIDTISKSQFTLDALTNLACYNYNGDDCYSLLRTCQSDNMCVQSLSCDCLRNFMSIVDNMTPGTYEKLMKLSLITLDEMRVAFGKCECTRLNKQAANVAMAGYCALQNSIVREESMFSSNITMNSILSTCADPLSCVSQMTRVVSEMSNYDGCLIKQQTDVLARVVFRLNDSSDLDVVAKFICNQPCYDDVKNNMKSGSVKCLTAFIDMDDSLSDDGRDTYLGIDSSTLLDIRSGIEFAQTNGIQPLESSEDTSQPNSASWSSNMMNVLPLGLVVALAGCAG